MRWIPAILCWAALAAAGEPPRVQFQSWSADLFARAQEQHRFVLLDLGAVWCHWCHVMEETTYRDAEVARLLGERFIAVRADQDADPDLSRRYEDYGWPATIVFAPDGSEIVKRRGYLPPAAMASLLQAIVDDPSPGPSVQPEPIWQPSRGTRPVPSLRSALERRFARAYDREHAGWGTIHKFLDGEAIEYALSDVRWQKMARATLDAALALVDPVWGGMYQYSDQLDWRSPHYEKIMSVQTQAIEMYALAWRRWHDPRHLEAARAIARYLCERLSSADGAFYVSQDADLDAHTLGKQFYALDDAGRRAAGLPAVDRHIYPRENGWAIAALAALAQATGDAALLARARAAGEWIERQRRLPDGGYRHGDADRAGPYLGDTLAMAEAWTALAAADAGGAWLGRAQAAVDFIDAHFRDARGGYFTAPAAADAAGVFGKPARLVDENVALARVALRLGKLGGQARAQTVVTHALELLTSPTLLTARPFSPGVLLLFDELASKNSTERATRPKE
jgi:uncharacterized protein YyaL (SSP411 family)